METIEKIVHFDEEGSAILKLGKNYSKKDAKIIVVTEDEEISEKDWLTLATKGASFDFLNNEEEDIYTIEDGIPFKNGNEE